MPEKKQINVNLRPMEQFRGTIWGNSPWLKLLTGLVLVGLATALASIWFGAFKLVFTVNPYVILMPILFVLLLVLSFWMARKLAPRDRVCLRLTFTKDGCQVSSRKIGYSWSDISVDETEESFLLAIKRVGTYVIPKRDFSDGSQLAGFKEMVGQNIGERAEFL